MCFAVSTTKKLTEANLLISLQLFVFKIKKEACAAFLFITIQNSCNFPTLCISRDISENWQFPGNCRPKRNFAKLTLKKPMDYYAFWKKKKQKLNYELFFNFLPFFFHIIINAQKKAGIELCSPLWNIKVFFLEKNCRPWRKTYTQDNHTSLFFSHLQKKCMCLFEKAYQKIFFLD